MSKQLTELEVLQQLGIPDFRHVTKDKVMEFASILGEMEPEVAKKAIDQFPAFAQMTREPYRTIAPSWTDRSTPTTGARSAAMTSMRKWSRR